MAKGSNISHFIKIIILQLTTINSYSYSKTIISAINNQFFGLDN